MENEKKILKSFFAITMLLLVSVASPAQEIFDAIKNKDLAKVKALIEQNPQVINQMDIRNLSPLHHALTVKSLELVLLLIENKADVNIAGRLGRTPLLWAISVVENSTDMISVLIDVGAQIEAKDSFGYTPLVYAAQRGNADVVNLLLSKNADIPIEPPNGRRLLSFCAQNGLKDLLKKAIEKGADIKVNGLLHSAASNGQNEIIQMLLSLNMDVNQRSRGWTPLHYASYNGHCSTIELLLARGTDIHARTDGMGQSAANLADENEKKDSVEFLGKKGLKLSPAAFPELRGEYLGQQKPGQKAEVFAPGIVNVPQTLHSSIVFSPDGKEAFWSFAFDNNRTMVSRLVNGLWTYPQRAVFQGIPLEDVPVFHPAGHSFYDLARFRPYPDGKKREKEDIWIWERSGSELKNPKPLPEEVNFPRHHWQFGVDEKGNIYFSGALPDTKGENDIYICRYKEGGYEKPENLGKNINTSGGEGFPYVSPDGRYILFVRNMDIYVSFRDKSDQWMKARPLGPEVNTPEMEILPTVSSDEKYLFFSRNQTLYWIDAEVIEALRPKGEKDERGEKSK